MQQIFETLRQSCPTFTLPGAWQHIPCDPEFFCLPADKAGLLAELQRQFSDADLIAAGVVQFDAAQTLTWHSNLLVDGEPIWAIRAKPELQPTTLLANMQTLGMDTWAFCLAFQEYRQSELIADAENKVVVAYSMADVAILRSLGIPAVPGGHWDGLSKPQVEYLFQKLRIPAPAQQPHRFASAMQGPAGTGPAGTGPAAEKPAAEGPADTEPLALILANWKVAAFDPADIGAATTSCSHLVDLSCYLKLDFDSFSSWKPSQPQLTQLRYQVQHLQVPQIRAGLLEGMEVDTSSLAAALVVKPMPAQTIIAATRAWQHTERNTLQPDESRKAFEVLTELYERQRFEPLVEMALQAQDPVESVVLNALAETSRLLQPQALQLTEKLRRSIAEKGSRAGSSALQPEMQFVLSQFDRLLALTKGVLECRRHQPSQRVLAPPPKTTPSHPEAMPSKPSASPPPNSPRSANGGPFTPNNGAKTH